MEKYFNIWYEFDKAAVSKAIDSQVKCGIANYICVADGVIMNMVDRVPGYMDVVNGGMFSICDSSYVPLYIKWIWGRSYEQYCGSQIFRDVIEGRRYRMFFMGAQQRVLESLKGELVKMNPDVEGMTFYELPFRDVNDFDYPAIARMVEEDGADIIWVALGAPKQEIFMNKLKPYLKHGVMIAVGAAFKFYSGVDVNRAPAWMVRHHLEFVYRIYSEPKKQLNRCAWIIRTLPGLLYAEWKRKNGSHLSEAAAR